LKKIKFGVFLPFYAFEPAEANPPSSFNRLQDIVLECERLGYDSLWLDDHLMFGKQPILECWTTLAALSALTSKIRLGTMVTCNSFRNPALLAKMAATLDVISNSRLELGIGAGVQKDEHVAYGMPFPASRDRIARMKEAVEIIKKLWTEEKTSYKGEYYRVDEAVCEPKPLQKPHPPLTIGGGGEKLTLKVVAEHADRCDVGYVPSLDLYQHKMDVLESHCKTVGRDCHEIEWSCWLAGQIFMIQDQKQLDEKVLQWKPKNTSVEDFKKHSFIATPEECRLKIQQYGDVGATYFMLFFGALPDVSGLRLFAEEVAKTMKSTD
jgi:F420-dependent oxidoreductase-like protein